MAGAYMLRMENNRHQKQNLGDLKGKEKGKNYLRGIKYTGFLSWTSQRWTKIERTCKRPKSPNGEME